MSKPDSAAASPVDNRPGFSRRDKIKALLLLLFFVTVTLVVMIPVPEHHASSDAAHQSSNGDQ